VATRTESHKASSSNPPIKRGAINYKLRILIVPANRSTICNAIIYSCLCGSHLAALQDRKGEIIYHFRQQGCYACQSLGNLVRMYFFKVFEYQVAMSARFDPHTLGLGGESVAQGCKNLPPVDI
jgi:hypothetical protein